MNVLYLLATPRITGGTPKKILDMIKHSHNQCVVYFWSDAYKDKQDLFRRAGATTYTGAYGRNIFKHIRLIANIIDKHSIEIVQTQFSFGEVLGFFLKLFKPRIKLIFSFVGPFNPSRMKKIILNTFYKRVDAFIYISEYVSREKLAAFPVLRKRPGKVIYNGSSPLPYSSRLAVVVGLFRIIVVSALVDLKNIETLIRAMGIIVHDMDYPKIELTVIGDGTERVNLERLIRDLELDSNVNLLGFREDVGDFLFQSNLFAHPSVAEGFGIAVIEAMLAGKPVILANAGALPELIINGESGLLVDPLDAQAWAGAIIKLMNDADLAQKLATNGKNRAIKMFSIEHFVAEYDKFYAEITENGLT